jgi:hypothetical protein
MGVTDRQPQCPEGAKQNSPGQRPGKLALFTCFAALKGRNNMAAKRLLRPFRAWILVLCETHGDALGCHVAALQAAKRLGDYL